MSSMTNHSTATGTGGVSTRIAEHYASFAEQKLSNAPLPAPTRFEGKTKASNLGYSAHETEATPKNANLGLGCGSPLSHVSPAEGESVLDIGCGGGLDCFIAAQRVGVTGTVIGVDANDKMIELARKNAEESGLMQVSFRQGNSLDLPVDSASVDLVISNCVMHMSEDIARAFREIARVLRPEGTACICDIALTDEERVPFKDLMKGYADCLEHALDEHIYLDIIRRAGFIDAQVAERRVWPYFRGYASLTIVAHKPAN